MNSDEWELEMNHMLDTFNHQAVFSLGKIKRRFETLGRPFDEEFRRNFLKMAILRLDTSFDTVLFSVHTAQIFEFTNSLKKEKDDGLIEVCDSEDDNHSAKELATDSIHDRVEIQTSDDKQHSTDAGCGNDANLSLETEFNGENEDIEGAVIEIFDLNDFGQQFEIQSSANVNENQTEMNEAVAAAAAAAMENSPQNNEKDIKTGAADLADENDVKPFIKVEPNGNNTFEVADIPMIEFNPNEENGDAAEVNGTGESSKTQQTDTSTNIGSVKLKQSANSTKRKGFKCDQCSFVLRSVYDLKQHQQVHANGKLIGVETDSNGLFQCTHCIRRFINGNYLSRHMKLHKNGRCLYYCARCMDHFDQKAKTERHERHCKGHHFECHLCKVYVTTRKGQLKAHMRTHSGAKPFQCMVCNGHFRQRSGLTAHLNRIHY